MGRALLVLANDVIRERAVDWIRRLPQGTRVEFKAPRRSLPQNDRFWASLTDVATQATHCGRKYDAPTWKAIFMSAFGKEVQFVPSLDGTELVPIGQSSSDLSKFEMSELLEFIYAWGSQNGVTFNDGASIANEGEAA